MNSRQLAKTSIRWAPARWGRGLLIAPATAFFWPPLELDLFSRYEKLAILDM